MMMLVTSDLIVRGITDSGRESDGHGSIQVNFTVINK